MISYMPFTVLEEHQLKMLSDTLGTLTVYSPADAIVPRHMRSWQKQGKLEIRHPEGVDEEQLLGAIENYKSWADLHQGHIGDMAGFFQTQKGQIPMVDDTNPTQIRHQIRHYGESSDPGPVGPLFKAALFLSMAQEYDMHQYGMVQDMDTVHDMEQQMLRRLSGDAQDVGVETPVAQIPLPSSAHQTIDDPYMTTQRIRAWSRLALTDAQAPMLYLTLSKTVVEQIIDLFPDALEMADLNLASPRIQETLQTLASESDVQTLASESDAHSLPDEKKNHLILYCLAGVTPFEFLHRIADPEPVGDGVVRPCGVPQNTFIGWVKT
jgi:hypothetical protein